MSPQILAQALGNNPVPAQPQPSFTEFQGLATLPSDRSLRRFGELEAAKGNQAFAWQTINPPNVETIYRPGMPIRMVSALDPTALKPGEFSLLQNVRPDSDVITARYPTTLFGGTATTFSPALPGGAAARGVWSGNLNGAQYVVSAWYDGAKVRLYSSTDGHSFTEQTATAGAYGNTRLTDSGALCAFQSVTNTGPTGSSADYLIINNGADDPRIYSPAAVNSANVFRIQNVAAPTAYETIAPNVAGVSGWVMPVNGSGMVATNSGAHVVFSAYSAGSFVLTFNSAIAAGDNAQLLGSAIAYFTSPNQQLCMVWDYPAGSDAFIAACKIEAYDSYSLHNWFTVYDPAGTVGSPPIEVPLDGALSTNPAAVFVWSMPTGTYYVQGIRLTIPSGLTPPTGAVTTKLYGLFASGSFPFGSSLAVSYQNSASLTESAGVVLATSTATPTYNACGMDASFSGNLPASASINLNYYIPAKASAQYASGVDTLNIYLSLPGSEVYGFAQSATIATYSGSWSASAAAQVPVTTQPVDTFTSPDAYATNLPTGTCMAAGSGRSFTGAGSKYWFSEYGYPFRYRLILDVEGGVARSSSGGYVSLPNTEKCAQFAVTGASALGTNSVYLFTDKSTYSIQGTDGQSLSSPSLLASVGCSAPGSVATYQDSIFFLDDNYQIRKFGYGKSSFYFYQNVNSYELMVPISKRVVDDQLRAIPSNRVSSAVGCAVYDRYYFAYSAPLGTTNTLMLVWDETIGSWVQDTPTAGACTVEDICPTVVGGLKKVYCQSSDRQCYDWENLSSSTAVAAKVSTCAMNPGGFGKTFFGRVGLVADVQAGQTLAVSKALIAGGMQYGTANSEASSIDMSTSVSGGQVFRWDSKTLAADGNTAPAGMSGLTCQITLGPLSMTPGSRIFAIVQEQKPASPGADML